jgi:hypothetical protein
MKKVLLFVVLLGFSCHKVVTPVANGLTPPYVKAAAIPVATHLVVPVAKAVTPPVLKSVAKGIGHTAAAIDHRVEGKPQRAEAPDKWKKQRRDQRKLPMFPQSPPSKIDVAPGGPAPLR